MRNLRWTKCHWDRLFSEFFDFELSISFHRVTPYLYIMWGINNEPVGGRSSETMFLPSTWTTLQEHTLQGYVMTVTLQARCQDEDTSGDCTTWNKPVGWVFEPRGLQKVKAPFSSFSYITFIMSLNRQDCLSTARLFSMFLPPPGNYVASMPKYSIKTDLMCFIYQHTLHFERSFLPSKNRLQRQFWYALRHLNVISKRHFLTENSKELCKQGTVLVYAYDVNLSVTDES
jgi:hypothetical protein